MHSEFSYWRLILCWHSSGPILKTTGYEAITASDLLDALSRLDEGYAAVLVAGRMMDETDRWCEEIHAAKSSQLVIIVSTPLGYYPPGSCPDHVVDGHPKALVEGIDAVLKSS